MTVCCKVRPHTLHKPLSKKANNCLFLLVCKLMVMCVLSPDPGKYNYTPRMFRLSASSGVFEGEEQLYPARVTEGVMAMPFLQENLYNTQQPGTTYQ